MDLNTILQQAQKLTSNEQTSKQKLFNVERTLPQVLQATKVSKLLIYKTKIFSLCNI